MYYTLMKHSGHFRTLEKCKKHSPAAPKSLENISTSWRWAHTISEDSISLTACETTCKKSREENPNVSIKQFSISAPLRIQSAIVLWIHSYFNKVMTKFTITNWTDAWKTDVNFYDHISKRRKESYVVTRGEVFLTHFFFGNVAKQIRSNRSFPYRDAVSTAGQLAISPNTSFSWLLILEI